MTILRRALGVGSLLVAATLTAPAGVGAATYTAEPAHVQSSAAPVYLVPVPSLHGLTLSQYLTARHTSCSKTCIPPEG